MEGTRLRLPPGLTGSKAIRVHELDSSPQIPPVLHHSILPNERADALAGHRVSQRAQRNTVYFSINTRSPAVRVASSRY
jgi:hypothetical protein